MIASMSPQNFHLSPIYFISAISVATTKYVNSLRSSLKRFYDAVIIVQKMIYSSFGELYKVLDSAGTTEISSNPELELFHSFTGREYDKETLINAADIGSGLYFYRARYYDAKIGRFISSDPHPGMLGDPLSLNSKYIYVRNNPLNLVDPNGKWGVLVGILVVAVVAGIYNGATNSNGASFGTNFWQGFVAGLAVSTAVTGAAYLGAWVGATYIGGTVAAFSGGVLGGMAGGYIGAELNARIKYGRSATENERWLGVLLGGISGGAVGYSYGANLGTSTAQQVNTNMTNNLPANDAPVQLTPMEAGCPPIGVLTPNPQCF